MKRYTKRSLGLAILAGAGIGVAAGTLIFNEKLRHQIGRRMRRVGRAFRHQSAELRDTATAFLERRGQELKGARDTGKRVYSRLAG